MTSQLSSSFIIAYYNKLTHRPISIHQAAQKGVHLPSVHTNKMNCNWRTQPIHGMIFVLNLETFISRIEDNIDFHTGSSYWPSIDCTPWTSAKANGKKSPIVQQRACWISVQLGTLACGMWYRPLTHNAKSVSLHSLLLSSLPLNNNKKPST